MKQIKEKCNKKCETIHLEEEGLRDFRLTAIIVGGDNNV